jgi:hypothetical protein
MAPKEPMTDTRPGRLFLRVTDQLDYLVALAGLRILDALAGPEPETGPSTEAGRSGADREGVAKAHW